MIITIYRLVGQIEYCYYVLLSSELSEKQLKMILWLVSETYEPLNTSMQSFFRDGDVLEIGPRLSVETSFSSNAVSACHSMGIAQVLRVERSIRLPYLSELERESLLAQHLDPLVQEVYSQTLDTFGVIKEPKSVEVIPLLEEGDAAILRFSAEHGLGFDSQDAKYYGDYFRMIGRNPTDVELYQIANGNSEHCRHWYFRGKLVIDGQEMSHTLLDLIRQPLRSHREKGNWLLAFNDNVGAIYGGMVEAFMRKRSVSSSHYLVDTRTLHPTGTGETHNHPTGVAPYPGAATGSGGRIRDTHAGGKGSYRVVGAIGYHVGKVSGTDEFRPGVPYPFASPRKILIEGSNGASHYQNAIGEPVGLGFARETCLTKANGEHREPVKPVLYSAGQGLIDESNLKKGSPQKGMFVVRIGGPAYEIGVGGGAASSVDHGSNKRSVDLASVQRGDPAMGNRAARVIIACAEMGELSPIFIVHDQGAGGASNVLAELIAPVGGRLNIRQIVLGDKSMSVLTIWVAEYQEGYGLLVHSHLYGLLKAICVRESVNCELVGEVTGDGNITLIDSKDGSTPVELNLEYILGDLPQKTFNLTRIPKKLKPFNVPSEVTLREAVQRVFGLLHVGSKGFLVSKADRSVGGKVRQQPCCGPNHIPVADVCVTSMSFEDSFGVASALGERPNILLVDAAAGARMALGEAVTNLASVVIQNLEYLSFRVNWMWPAKLPGEGALLYDAAQAVSKMMLELGCASCGGKDSLSMSAKVDGEVVKSPGQVVLFGYAFVQDTEVRVTPDFKKEGNMIGYVDLGLGRYRLGGSCLAEIFDEIGDEAPDVDVALLKEAFQAIQKAISHELIVSLHDRSDGGLIATLAEMCMSGNQGATIHLFNEKSVFEGLFSEELGWLFEFSPESRLVLKEIFDSAGITFNIIGSVGGDSLTVIEKSVKEEGKILFSESLVEVRRWWEEKSLSLEPYQTSPECVEGLVASLDRIHTPEYKLSFTPRIINRAHQSSWHPKVAVIRAPGTNGDNEMSAALYAADMDPWDVTVSDLVSGTVDLDLFQGVVFPGGFSFMDVFDSGKAFAGTILFNEKLKDMFTAFRARKDTFSLGVCNGCQVMALLGWVPGMDVELESQPRFIHNTSGRFQSGWAHVKFEKSPSVLLRGMENSSFGVWYAHGEGRAFFPDSSVLDQVLAQGLAPIRYVDMRGEATELYPENPNGSVMGIAALCSPDGRHLAMMPHPERCFLIEQWPWMPASWKRDLWASPWLKMFENAYEFCAQHRS